MPTGIYDRSKANIKPPSNKKFIDKEWLEKEYIQNQKGTRTIAKELGCGVHAVTNCLRRHGIPVRNRYDIICRDAMANNAKLLFKKYDVYKEYLEREYIQNRKTINQIAQELKCSWDVVRKKIHHFNLPIRRNDLRNIQPRTGTRAKQFQKIVYKAYGYKCAICGYDKFVNAHHIERFAETANDTLENGICLCPNHHAEADNLIILPQELRQYQITSHK